MITTRWTLFYLALINWYFKYVFESMKISFNNFCSSLQISICLQEEYSGLCLLLTLPKLTDSPDYRLVEEIQNLRCGGSISFTYPFPQSLSLSLACSAISSPLLFSLSLFFISLPVILSLDPFTLESRAKNKEWID